MLHRRDVAGRRRPKFQGYRGGKSGLKQNPSVKRQRMPTESTGSAAGAANYETSKPSLLLLDGFPVPKC